VHVANGRALEVGSFALVQVTGADDHDLHAQRIANATAPAAHPA